MNEAFVTDFDNKEMNYFDNFNKENNEERVKITINNIKEEVNKLFEVKKLGVSDILMKKDWWEKNFSRSTILDDIYGNDIKVKIVAKAFDPRFDDEEYSIDTNFHKTIKLPINYISFSELTSMDVPDYVFETYNIACDEDWINLVRKESTKFVIKCLVGVHSNGGWKKLYDTGWVWIMFSDPITTYSVFGESMKIYFKVLDYYRESLNHLKDNLISALTDIVKNPDRYDLLTESFEDDFSKTDNSYFDTFNKDNDEYRIKFIDEWMAKHTWFSLTTVKYLDGAFNINDVLPSSYQINSDFTVDVFRPVGDGIDSKDERWTFHIGMIGEDFEDLRSADFANIPPEQTWLKKLANVPVEQLPFKFKNCYVNFNVDCNLLKDLTNCPKTVHGAFSCMEQSGRWSDGTGQKSVLTSLKGSPESCYSYYCGYNMNLKSLEGMTKNINVSIDLTQTGIESLEGCPEKILGGLSCNSCPNLENFIGAPKDCDYILATDDMYSLKSTEGLPADGHVKKLYIDYKHIEENNQNKLEESFDDDFEKSEDEPTYINTFNKEDNEYYWNEVLKKLDAEWFNRMITFKQKYSYAPYVHGGQTVDLGEITKNPWFVIKITYTNKENWSAYGGRGGSDSHYVSFKVYKRWYQTERKSATKSEELYRSRMFRYSAYPGYDGLPSIEEIIEICKKTITQVLKKYYLNILPSVTNESFDDEFTEEPKGDSYFDTFSRNDANYNAMTEWLDKSIKFSLPSHIAKAYWKIRYDENVKDYIVDLLVEPKEGYNKHGYKNGGGWNIHQTMSSQYATFKIQPFDLPEFTKRSHPELHDIIEKEVKELTARGEQINWQDYYWGKQRFDRITVPNYKFPYNIKFGICEGILYAEDMGLTDMTSLPRKIYGSLCVSGNNFKSFYGCPDEIGGDIFAGLNLIESFDGLPANYKGSLFVCHNKIKTLKGLPAGVDRLEMEDNLLLSLDGFPSQVIRKADFSYNRIVDLHNCCGNLPCVSSINIEHNFLPKSITLTGYFGREKIYEKRVKPQDPISKEDKKKLLAELAEQRRKLFGVIPIVNESFEDEYSNVDNQNYFDTFSKESSGEMRRLITEWINENLIIGHTETSNSKTKTPEEGINYKINDDNTIDLFEIKDRDVYDSNYTITGGCVPDKNGTKLPDYIQFNTCHNCAICAIGLDLDTLKGFPKTIIIDGMFQEFDVRDNKLQTFEGCPNYVVKSYPGGNLIARFMFEDNEIDFDHQKLKDSPKPLKDYKLPFVIHENRTIEYGKKDRNSVPNYVAVITSYSIFELYEKPWFNEEYFTNEAWNLRIKWRYNQIHQKAYNINDIHYNIYGLPCTDELKKIFDAEQKRRTEEWERKAAAHYKNQIAASKQKHLQEGFDNDVDFDDEKETDATYFDTFVKGSEGESENYQNQAIEWIESHFDKLLGSVSSYGENKVEGVNSTTKMFEYRTQKVYDGINLYTKGDLSYNEPGEFTIPGYVHWMEHDGNLAFRANGKKYESVACYIPTLIGMPKIVTGKFELNICDDSELENLKGMPEEVENLQIILGKVGNNLDAYWGTNYMPKWIKHDLTIYDFSRNDTPKLISMAPFQNTRIGSRDYTKKSWDDNGSAPSFTLSGPGITGLSGLDKIIEHENSEVYMIYINETNITSLDGVFPEELKASNIHIEKNKNLTSLTGMPKILKTNYSIGIKDNALTSLQGMSSRIIIDYYNDDAIYKLLSEKDRKTYTEKTGRTYIELDPTNSRERVPIRKIAKAIINYSDNNFKGDPFKTVKDAFYETLSPEDEWKKRFYKQPTGKPDQWGWRDNCRKELVLDITYK